MDHIHIADLELRRSSAPNSAYNTPSTSRVTSPVGSPRTSMESERPNNHKYADHTLSFKLMSFILTINNN
ncbi:hypothetical protein CONCODRAFT_2430 [Conidiobolus coronatus NRRL 28638]|uniref:Uncharacterized protein n=1 Tax=Conidiobolus coronatus (strain ATCC 28846 / CBS 209.66 / NRRL 28638) TaxID=796925 RepID=A0A137PI21_CONC2|nr:hypothetical protein CONCODRAFT_2430 [Conidiobolus coronatus NRRL 28638]|eukprot:KXN74620.1 hypothetical protein CONCODRAFT_2430 [Conidiobolus coronatus NRRL 28638]